MKGGYVLFVNRRNLVHHVQTTDFFLLFYLPIPLYRATDCEVAVSIELGFDFRYK